MDFIFFFQYWETQVNLYNGRNMISARALKRSNALPQFCIPSSPQNEREWMRGQYRKNASWSQRHPGEWVVANLAGKCRLWKCSLYSCQRFIKKNPRYLPHISFSYMCQKYTNIKYSFMQPVEMNTTRSNENLLIAPIFSIKILCLR